MCHDKDDGERALHTCRNAIARIVLNCTIWRPIVIPPMAHGWLPYATTSFQRISVITFAPVWFPNLRVFQIGCIGLRSLSRVCTHAEPDIRSRTDAREEPGSECGGIQLEHGIVDLTGYNL